MHIAVLRYSTGKILQYVSRRGGQSLLLDTNVVVLPQIMLLVDVEHEMRTPSLCGAVLFQTRNLLIL